MAYRAAQLWSGERPTLVTGGYLWLLMITTLLQIWMKSEDISIHTSSQRSGTSLRKRHLFRTLNLIPTENQPVHKLR